jgi:Xaa-Pro aminopeptidase
VLPDLHESAHFDRMGPLREGMVITVEPGEETRIFWPMRIS